MTDNFYIADCGCKFQVFDNEKFGDSKIPPIEIDYYNINYKCPKIWQLLQEGQTVGIFQLEKSLGRNWSKQMNPSTLEEVSALTAVIRPGTMKAKMEDGKTAAKHFVDRKNFIEEVESIDETIDDITEETFGIILYQETAMKIATKVAGFNLKQADSLRKAMGKKDAALMAKTRQEFIEGCKTTNIISESKAHFIFDIIEKSNRYSFNKCWDLSTVVTTPDGYKLLDEVNIGDKVLCPISDIENDFIEVTDKMYNGNKDIVEFKTETGKTVRCTLEHKFMCEDGISRPLYEILENNLSIMCED